MQRFCDLKSLKAYLKNEEASCKLKLEILTC